MTYPTHSFHTLYITYFYCTIWWIPVHLQLSWSIDLVVARFKIIKFNWKLWHFLIYFLLSVKLLVSIQSIYVSTNIYMNIATTRQVTERKETLRKGNKRKYRMMEEEMTMMLQQITSLSTNKYPINHSSCSLLHNFCLKDFFMQNYFSKLRWKVFVWEFFGWHDWTQQVTFLCWRFFYEYLKSFWIFYSD